MEHMYQLNIYNDHSLNDCWFLPDHRSLCKPYISFESHGKSDISIANASLNTKHITPTGDLGKTDIHQATTASSYCQQMAVLTYPSHVSQPQMPDGHSQHLLAGLVDTLMQ